MVNAETGEAFPTGGEYLELDEPRRLVLTWGNPDDATDDRPFAQRLLTSPIPARLAYVALDGTPRAIPIGYLYTDGRFVMATAEGAPKIAALRVNPTVALTIDTETQPPVVLLVRGTVELEMVDGVPAEYLEASRKAFGEEEFAAFRDGVRALYDRMCTIVLTPTWAKVLDFETRIPDTVQRLVDAKAGDGVAGRRPGVAPHADPPAQPASTSRTTGATSRP